MARAKVAAPTLEAILFQTPEQRVLRLLLCECTTAFSPRVIASKLKGVRGLGGPEGIVKILEKLETLGMVDFLNNRREVRLHDDNTNCQMLKVMSAVCDLESLKVVLEPLSSRAVLIGSRATGKARSDSDYDICISTESAGEVRKAAERHPLSKRLSLHLFTPDEALHLDEKDAKLAAKVARGVVLWGPV